MSLFVAGTGSVIAAAYRWLLCTHERKRYVGERRENAGGKIKRKIFFNTNFLRNYNFAIDFF